MRLLPGAETNTPEIRKKFKFKTKFRLIHGDVSSIKMKNGSSIKAFEYEESLRSTSTMSEKDLFYLRKLHFLVDFCWNIEVYKPLLQVCLFYKINPIDILIKLLEKNDNFKDLDKFFKQFDDSSKKEWFKSDSEIKKYFNIDKNFNKLLNNEFDKLNVLYSVVLLKDFKSSFDKSILDVIKTFNKVPKDTLIHAAELSFSSFPPLTNKNDNLHVKLPDNFYELNKNTAYLFEPSKKKLSLKLYANKKRKEMLSIIQSSSQKSLSKILNTQGFSLRDLRLVSKEAFSFDNQFRRSNSVT